MSEFSYRTRRKDFSLLNGRHFRCLIIGGGIVGAGIANLLSHNGIEVLLVEKGDFASGTSSGSSKLIHGGIRYLAQGHVKLTRDLLRERNYLMRNTDIVRRLDFDILVDEYSWSPWYMRMGLFLYSVLGGKPSIPRMVRNAGEYVDGVAGYFPYFDGATDDARLVIYNIVSAHDRGAVCLNYVEAASIREGDRSVSVGLRDSVDGREASITADLVLNCAGPWVNRVLSLKDPGLIIPMKLSNGVHLVFPRERIPVTRAVTFRSHIDRRQMFIIPKEKVCIVGTTDTIVESPDDLVISERDVKYIVDSVRRLFPGVGEDDITGKYCGIRPLIGRGDNADRISRDFSIFVHGKVVSVAGVKLTDFRHSSRKLAARISELTGWSIRTDGLPELSYRRPEVDDLYSYEINHECAIFPEDILRRREGVSIYDPDDLESAEMAVKDAFEREVQKDGE